MSRRRQPPADSLEMLLDTMCNTFGGIILIALLVSLLARDLKQSKATAVPVEESRLSEMLSDATATQEELANRLADPRHTNTVALIQQRDALTREVEALRQQMAAAARRADPAVATSNALARAKELTRQNEQLQLELSAAAREAGSAENKIRDIERQKEGQIRQMRLPIEQTDQREQWFVALRHGRVYPIYYYQPQQILTRVRNTAMLDWEGSEGAEIVKPKLERGIDLKTDAAAFRTLMQALPRTRIYVVFLTYGDSYAAFTEAKRIVLELGLGHGLQLMPERQPIAFGPDGERIRRQ